jgi:hypothetical protein
MRFAKGLEGLNDPMLLATQQPTSFQNLPLSIHAANSDRLFVEVNADVQHGESPLVETGKGITTYSGLPRTQSRSTSRPDLLHSFTLSLTNANEPAAMFAAYRGEEASG